MRLNDVGELSDLRPPEKRRAARRKG